jgi:4-amino-4-deoxy-L-arabinose transferase-like glycosyltransferase
MRLGRIPRAGWACALAACLNAVCWSLITPPFQAPDEPDHYAYVAQLALAGALPTSNAEGAYPADESLALSDLHYGRVRLQPEDPAIYSRAEERKLRHDLAFSGSPTATGAAGVATGEPPLYYMLELIPYELGSGATVLERLELMRLLSALLAGLTALFVFLFVREALPRDPWAWPIGGMGVALTPLLGFMSGAVTSEAMLYAVSAAAFYYLARAFRRGLTPRRAAAIGAVVAIGLLTKLNFAGLIPGIALGLIVLTHRAARSSRSAAYRSLLLALAIAQTPVIVSTVVGALSDHSTLSSVNTALQAAGQQGSLLGRIDYTWQFFLPRLPGMPSDFPGIFTTRQIWFNGLVGLYGWLDTTFPGWVYTAALLPTGLLTLLCVRALVHDRSGLRARVGELAVYAVMAVGLLALIGSASYAGFPRRTGDFAESRYLLPLLALMGAALALAARGAGRRWGPVVGTLILVLCFAHDLFSQLLTVARYYG